MIIGGKGLLSLSIRRLLAVGTLKQKNFLDTYVATKLFMGHDDADEVFFGDEKKEQKAMKLLDEILKEYRNDREKIGKLEKIKDEMAIRARVSSKNIDVRIDQEASEKTRTKGVLGLEEGGRIYLDMERFEPETKEGRTTLGHEIAHIAQIEKGIENRGLQRADTEAEIMGRALANSQPVDPPRFKIQPCHQMGRENENILVDILSQSDSYLVRCLIEDPIIRGILESQCYDDFTVNLREQIIETLEKISDAEMIVKIQRQTNEKFRGWETAFEIVRGVTNLVKAGVSVVGMSLGAYQTLKGANLAAEMGAGENDMMKRGLKTLLSSKIGFVKEITKAVYKPVKIPKPPEWLTEQESMQIEELMKIFHEQISAVLIVAGRDQRSVCDNNVQGDMPISNALRVLSPNPNYKQMINRGAVSLSQKDFCVSPSTGQPIGDRIEIYPGIFRIGEYAVPIKEILDTNPDNIRDEIERKRLKELKSKLLKKMVGLSKEYNSLFALVEQVFKIVRMKRKNSDEMMKGYFNNIQFDSAFLAIKTALGYEMGIGELGSLTNQNMTLLSYCVNTAISWIFGLDEEFQDLKGDVRAKVKRISEIESSIVEDIHSAYCYTYINRF